MKIYNNFSKKIIKHASILGVVTLFSFANVAYADCKPGSCAKGEVCRIMGTDGKKSCEKVKTKNLKDNLKKEGIKPDGNLGGEGLPQ